MNRQPAPSVLAIDLGTSGAKVAVVDARRRRLGWARAEVETLRLPGGGVEQDPVQVWHAVLEASARALTAPQVDRTQVRAVICASQYSSIVPVDAHGESVANMILWQDMRGTKQRLRQLPGYPRRADNPLALLRWLRVHGLPPVADGLSLNHMRYLAYAHPEVYERTATFLEPMDYVTLRLSGRACANQCTALMSLSVDNRRLGAVRYDDRLVRASLIDPGKLPDLVPVGSIVGRLLPEIAEHLGVPATTVVVSGVNDTQAGAVGAGGLSGEHAVVSLGSTTVLTTHHRSKRTDVRHAVLTVPGPVPERYLLMAENGLSGGVIDRMAHGLLGLDGAAALSALAAQAPVGSNGLLFLPWIAGTMAPAEDGRMRGGVLNMSVGTTRAELARAVLEGLALNLRWMRDPVQKLVKRRFSHYTCYGGGARSDLWCQILADALDRPVNQLADPHLTVADGVALLALQALGLRDLDAGSGQVLRIYAPDPAAVAVYDRIAPQLAKAHTATRPIVRALNRPDADI